MKGGERLNAGEMRQILSAALGVILFGGLSASVFYAIVRRSRIWPPRLSLLPPWSTVELCIAALLVVAIPATVFRVFQQSGFFLWYYGSNPDSNDKADIARAGLWVALSTPITILVILLVLRAISGTRPSQIGLGDDHWVKNITLGYIACALLAPLTFLVHFVTRLTYSHFTPGEPVMHPLQKLAMERADAIEWILIVAQATVFAPLLEEFLFRGLILPWATRRWFGGWTAAVAALILAGLRVPESVGPIVMMAPALALMALSLRQKPAEQFWWANLGASLLFAMMHASVWPTPIPLVFLSLGLGWLRNRTQSLWGPIVLHGLFNAVSTLLLLRGIDVK